MRSIPSRSFGLAPGRPSMNARPGGRCHDRHKERQQRRAEEPERCQGEDDGDDTASKSAGASIWFDFAFRARRKLVANTGLGDTPKPSKHLATNSVLFSRSHELWRENGRRETGEALDRQGESGAWGEKARRYWAFSRPAGAGETIRIGVMAEDWKPKSNVLRSRPVSGRPSNKIAQQPWPLSAPPGR